MRLLYAYILFSSLVYCSQEYCEKMDSKLQDVPLFNTYPLKTLVISGFKVDYLSVPGRTVTYYERKDSDTYYERTGQRAPLVTWDHICHIFSQTKLYSKN